MARTSFGDGTGDNANTDPSPTMPWTWSLLRFSGGHL